MAESLENPAAGIMNLSPQYQITDSSGKMTPTFEKDYTANRNFLLQTLKIEWNRGISYSDENPQKFIENFQQSPELQRSFTQELLTFLDEIKDTRMVNGVRLYDHQYAILIWLSQIMCSSKNPIETFLIQGSGGIGKTIILGIITAVLIRLQIRNVLKGGVAICAHKAYILMQQLFSKDEIFRNAARSGEDKEISIREVNSIAHFATQLTGCPDIFDRVFLGQICRDNKESEDVFIALERHVRKSETGRQWIKNYGTEINGHPEWHHKLQELCLVITHRALLLLAPNQSDFQYCELPTVDTENSDRLGKKGDMGFGIPDGYRERDLIIAKTGGSFNKVPSNTEITHSNRHRLFLLLSIHLLRQDWCAKIPGIAGVQAIVVDETQEHPGNQWQSAIMNIRDVDDKSPAPLVFAAMAEAAGDQRQGYINFDRKSPRPPLRILLNSEDEILPPLAPYEPMMLDVDPDSEEGMDRMVLDHFAHWPLLEKLELPQLHTVDGAILVHPDNVETFIKKLEAKYAEKGMGAQIISFDANKDPPHCGTMMSIMQGKYPVPRILVSSPKHFKFALDFPNLWYITAATTYGLKDRQQILRLIDRIEHGSLHRQGISKNVRVVLRLPCFSDDAAKNSAFHLINSPEAQTGAESMLSIPGMVALPEQIRKKDVQLVTEHEDVRGSQYTVLLGKKRGHGGKRERKELKDKKPEPKPKTKPKSKPQREVIRRQLPSVLVPTGVEGDALPGFRAQTVDEFLQEVKEWDFLSQKCKSEWDSIERKMRAQLADDALDFESFKIIVWTAIKLIRSQEMYEEIVEGEEVLDLEEELGAIEDLPMDDEFDTDGADDL